MIVLSLFDGKSCGQQALKECGVKVEKYFASEIDKYAISVTQYNFPNTIQLGSVVNVNGKELPKIDLLIGGSPCQSFSFAGKTNTLTSVQKDNLIMQVNPSTESNGNQPYQQNRVYDVEGILPALSAGLGGRNNIVVPNNNALNDNQLQKFNPNPNTEKHNTLTLAIGRAGSSSKYVDSVSKIAKITSSIRRLTPIECERLQTLPDNYTAKGINTKGEEVPISDTQRYKMIGNGWTIKVISHIFNYIK